MAMQIGLSRVLLIAGAGYTSILVRNGKLSDVIAEIQALLNGSGEQEGDSDKIASQMYNRLLEEIRTARQTVVLNANGGGQSNLSSLIVPAATLGAVGYGYMWWKGLKFSDLMYVTKRNMAAAVTNLTKSLDTVKEAVVNTKKHLTQRIQNLDDKVLEQNDLSKAIQKDVAGVQKNLTDLDINLVQLQQMVAGLGWKLESLEDKQDFANMGVSYLCSLISGKPVKMPENLQKQLKLSDDNARGGRYLPYSGDNIMIGLKSALEGTLLEGALAKDGITKLEEPPKNLPRSVSAKC
ncbi:uncharacterized protein LOC126789939 [Argentina anserina]|uniref:uncharacterized protein LOC126789939 n=1 Tax=Argentina anserina TaxID=57926 RepID=UPI0021764330|nr:uncharacterized protein LOC126789939 [Potentilla anserina]